MEVSNGLKDALGRLDELLAERLPGMAAALRPGAGERELAAFEAEFGRVLPAEFRELYRWHDGTDFVGYHSLPGIGHWRLLFMLPDRCLEWQASWDLGFDPWWIPLTVEDYGQTVHAIDAGGVPDAPAPVLFYEIPDGCGAAAVRVPSSTRIHCSVRPSIPPERSTASSRRSVVAVPGPEESPHAVTVRASTAARRPPRRSIRPCRPRGWLRR